MKYPNADTSPERLAAIETAFHSTSRATVNEAGLYLAVHDLLAMLQERLHSQQFYYEQYKGVVKVNMDIFQTGGPLDYLLNLGQSCTLDGPKAAADEIARLKQQLYDQRWRRLTEEEPVEGQLVNLINSETPNSLIYDFHKVKDKAEIWWRPITPLPKESG